MCTGRIRARRCSVGPSPQTSPRDPLSRVARSSPSGPGRCQEGKGQRHRDWSFRGHDGFPRVHARA